MKIKSPIGFLALWSAVLATGTWILPVGTILALNNPLASALSDSPTGTESQHDELALRLDRSSLGASWKRAWGDSVSVSGSFVFMSSNGVGDHLCELHCPSGASPEAIGEASMTQTGLWREAANFELGSIDATAAGWVESSSEVTFRLAAGEIVGALDRSEAFISLLIDITRRSESGELARGSLLLPLQPVKSIDVAVETIVALESGAPGEGGLFCVNPSWTGEGGVECCELFQDYQIALRACREDLKAGIWSCLFAAGASGGGLGGACLLGCFRKFPGLPLKCLAVCGLVGFVAGSVVLIFCLREKLAQYEACRLRAQLDYRRALRDSGCAPAPDGYEP